MRGLANRVALATGEEKWDITYSGRVTSASWVLFSSELTVEKLAKSTITANLYQSATNLGSATVCFREKTSEGYEFQLQKIHDAWNKSERVRFKDETNGLMVRVGYTDGSTVGRYGSKNTFLVPHDFRTGTYAGTSNYFVGDVRVVGPVSNGGV